MNEDIINKSGNKHCAICAGKNPSWGCLPFAILVCTKCAGTMRELGTDTCIVKSLLLDSVSDDFLKPFITGSNSLFLDWLSENSKKEDIVELTSSFFKTKLAKEYSKQLKDGVIKEKAIKNAPEIGLVKKLTKNLEISSPQNSAIKQSRRKSKLKLVSYSDDETEKNGISFSNDDSMKPLKINKSKEVIQEIKKPSIKIKRVPGRIIADSVTRDTNSGNSNAARLGMFKNVNDKKDLNDLDEVEKSTMKIHNKSITRIVSGNSQNIKIHEEGEIIEGKNFISSAASQKETVVEKLKKSLEKGKTNLLNRFNKK